ncbi:MAG: hydroxymethylglutaryl-CoA lyase [Burkholderiaceae bacterium]
MKRGQQQRIHINEVATRDGLQMESHFVPTADKVALLDELSQCGYAKIEVTSFTSPKAIPTLKDAEDVMQQIRRHPELIYTGLVPNERGAKRAMDAYVDEFNLVMSVTDTHNLTNLRMTCEQSFAQLKDVIKLSVGADMPVNVSLSCAFGCPMEGDVSTDTVRTWVDQFAELGIAGITLCDTTGMAFPSQVFELCEPIVRDNAGMQITGHFHNTRGMGQANVLAAIEAGIDSFDTSLGGIGGCPYAPGATGNVATEDVVHMLECMGYDTHINLDGVLAAGRHLAELIGHDLPSQLSHAGPRDQLHPVPDDFDEIKSAALARD